MKAQLLSGGLQILSAGILEGVHRQPGLGNGTFWIQASTRNSHITEVSRSHAGKAERWGAHGSHGRADVLDSVGEGWGDEREWDEGSAAGA